MIFIDSAGVVHRGEVLELATGFTLTANANGQPLLGGGSGGGGSPAAAYSVLIFDFKDPNDSLPNGLQAYAVIPDSGTITEVWVLCEDSKTVTVDFWKSTYANFSSMTAAQSICGSDPVVLTAARKVSKSVLTLWSTELAARDILAVNLSNVSVQTSLLSVIVFITLQ